MKILLISFSLLFFVPPNPHWITEFNSAVETAKTEDKNILLYFSGSDWCKPCIQLKTYVLDTPEFKEYVENKFVLVQADFPRLKKNRLSQEQVEQNEILAEKYDMKGIFPLIVVLNTNGEVIQKLEYNFESATDFIGQLKNN